MTTAYIALGSNLGDRWATLSAAVRRLRAEPGLRVLDNSEVYETAPVNCPPDSGAFLNAVNRIEGTRKAVQVLGASPIIRALLLLIGLSPRHFVKKAA